MNVICEFCPKARQRSTNLHPYPFSWRRVTHTQNWDRKKIWFTHLPKSIITKLCDTYNNITLQHVVFRTVILWNQSIHIWRIVAPPAKKRRKKASACTEMLQRKKERNNAWPQQLVIIQQRTYLTFVAKLTYRRSRTNQSERRRGKKKVTGSHQRFTSMLEVMFDHTHVHHTAAKPPHLSVMNRLTSSGGM